MVRLGVQRRNAAHGFPEPALDAMARRRIAGLLGDGEAESRALRGRLGRPGVGLQAEGGGVDAPALGSALIFAAPRQPAPWGPIGGQGSGRKLLATSRATGVQHLAAAHGRHTGAKPMTTFAHEFARLISALHGSSTPEPAGAVGPKKIAAE